MSASLTLSEFFLAVSGGLIPPLIWLWFWLREDEHPEPTGILMLTFAGGIAAVPAALAIEFLISKAIPVEIIAIFLWAVTEECLKFFFAWKAALSKPCFDEPVDALIYMITAALGFASLENILFVYQSVSNGGVVSGLMTGNLRFLGAVLLHTFASAIVGAYVAFSFYRKEKRIRSVLSGLVTASVLHFLFNYSIMKAGEQEGENLFKIFIPLWLGIILVIFIFEKVKKIKS